MLRHGASVCGSVFLENVLPLDGSNLAEAIFYFLDSVLCMSYSCHIRLSSVYSMSPYLPSLPLAYCTPCILYTLHTVCNQRLKAWKWCIHSLIYSFSPLIHLVDLYKYMLERKNQRRKTMNRYFQLQSEINKAHARMHDQRGWIWQLSNSIKLKYHCQIVCLIWVENTCNKTVVVQIYER